LVGGGTAKKRGAWIGCQGSKKNRERNNNEEEMGKGEEEKTPPQFGETSQVFVLKWIQVGHYW